MYTVEEIRAEYNRLDRLCGVDTAPVAIMISKKSVRRYGSCTCKSGGPTCIRIAAFLLEEDAAFWDTVRHEYAHALVALRHPGHNHGHDAVWRAACVEVGCQPERLAASCSGFEEKRRSAVKYRVTCGACGRSSEYLRRGRVVDALLRGRPCVCACGGKRIRLEEVG